MSMAKSTKGTKTPGEDPLLDDWDDAGDDEDYKFADILNRLEGGKKKKEVSARRRYERMQEDRRLRDMLGDDFYTH